MKVEFRLERIKDEGKGRDDTATSKLGYVSSFSWHLALRPSKISLLGPHLRPNKF